MCIVLQEAIKPKKHVVPKVNHIAKKYHLDDIFTQWLKSFFVCPKLKVRAINNTVNDAIFLQQNKYIP